MTVRAVARPVVSGGLITAAWVFFATQSATLQSPSVALRPIEIVEQGSFMVGGTVLTNPGTFDPRDPNPTPAGQTVHGDHAYDAVPRFRSTGGCCRSSCGTVARSSRKVGQPRRMDRRASRRSFCAVGSRHTSSTSRGAAGKPHAGACRASAPTGALRRASHLHRLPSRSVARLVS